MKIVRKTLSTLFALVCFVTAGLLFVSAAQAQTTDGYPDTIILTNVLQGANSQGWIETQDSSFVGQNLVIMSGTTVRWLYRSVRSRVPGNVRFGVPTNEQSVPSQFYIGGFILDPQEWRGHYVVFTTMTTYLATLTVGGTVTTAPVTGPTMYTVGYLNRVDHREGAKITAQQDFAVSEHNLDDLHTLVGWMRKCADIEYVDSSNFFRTNDFVNRAECVDNWRSRLHQLHSSLEYRKAQLDIELCMIDALGKGGIHAKQYAMEQFATEIVDVLYSRITSTGGTLYKFRTGYDGTSVTRICTWFRTLDTDGRFPNYTTEYVTFQGRN